jgi:hypothetical protein
MNEANVNAIRNALLYMAARYHQISYRSEMFDDGAITDLAVTAERNAQRLSNTIGTDGITTAEDAALATGAVSALVDSMNTELQKLHSRGQVNDAALVEHRIRECYDAMAAVSVIARGMVQVGAVTA